MDTPQPFSIWVADAAGGPARAVWRSPKTLAGSFPDLEGGANLVWAAGDTLVFLCERDNWPHLYAVPAAGGEARLLTPGAFMVEHLALSRDRRFMIYDANTGAAADDDDRRHLFKVPVDGGVPWRSPAAKSLEWSPVAAGEESVAFVAAGPRTPAAVAVVGLDGAGRRTLTAPGLESAFPADALIAPKSVSWTAPDGVVVHGQLFQRAEGPARKPGVIFVHGGPERQMLLGWHYMDYYSNAYAMNQYLADHGFVVLSINYRLGIGYGRAFQHPPHAGPGGAAEYQDVLSGARWLQRAPGVDPARIGIWGGSYGGYLTGLALARNSDLFKAGVDLHGVHDWSVDTGRLLPPLGRRYETGDRAEAMRTAFASSPGRRCGHLDLAGPADPGRRRSQRRIQPDDRPRPAPRRQGRRFRGAGFSRRDPHLPALQLLAEGGCRHGGFPRPQTGGERAVTPRATRQSGGPPPGLRPYSPQRGEGVQRLSSPPGGSTGEAGDGGSSGAQRPQPTPP